LHFKPKRVVDEPGPDRSLAVSPGNPIVLTVLEDSDGLPANYGALAAILANARHATLMHVKAVWDDQVFADAAQHVTADGQLVSSGLVWAERLGVRAVSSPVTANELLDRAAREDVVVPLHPCNTGSIASAQELIAEARSRGVQHENYRVMRNAANAWIVDATTLNAIREIGTWTPDRFGRLSQGQHTQGLVTTPLHIALVGSERDHQGVNPTMLAALGDAADAQDMDVEITYISPQLIDIDNVARLFAGVDGIMLPGGSDMNRVPGQVIAARYALVSRVPVAGLCLGMQTMATAAAQLASGSDAGSDEVGLAEANPAASLHSFIRLTADDGSYVHRLGDQVVEIEQGSRLHEILGDRFTVRTNHRFRLNPRVLGLLNDAGVTVCAKDASGHIADAIEARDHPFYIGMQGHPEVSSAAGHAHPFLCAFLETAFRLRKK
jgi:CTP synthase